MITVCESVNIGNFGSQAKMPNNDSLSEIALKGGKELMMMTGYTWGKTCWQLFRGQKIGVDSVEAPNCPLGCKTKPSATCSGLSEMGLFLKFYTKKFSPHWSTTSIGFIKSGPFGPLL